MPTQGLKNSVHVAYAEYDFAKDGGAVGDINLRGAKLPEGAIVIRTTIHSITAIVSGGATTIALKLQTAADMLAATAKASFSANALLDGVQVDTAATMIRCTAARTPVATVAVAAITAGKFVVAMQYIMTV